MFPGSAGVPPALAGILPAGGVGPEVLLDEDFLAQSRYLALTMPPSPLARKGQPEISGSTGVGVGSNSNYPVRQGFARQRCSHGSVSHAGERAVVRDRPARKCLFTREPAAKAPGSNAMRPSPGGAPERPAFTQHYLT